MAGRGATSRPSFGARTIDSPASATYSHQQPRLNTITTPRKRCARGWGEEAPESACPATPKTIVGARAMDTQPLCCDPTQSRRRENNERAGGGGGLRCRLHRNAKKKSPPTPPSIQPGVCQGADNQGPLLITTNSTQNLPNLRRTSV